MGSAAGSVCNSFAGGSQASHAHGGHAAASRMSSTSMGGLSRMESANSIYGSPSAPAPHCASSVGNVYAGLPPGAFSRHATASTSPPHITKNARPPSYSKAAAGPGCHGGAAASKKHGRVSPGGAADPNTAASAPVDASATTGATQDS